MIGMEEEGILCADRFDYDQDGDEEIFVVVLSGSGTPWWYSRAFLLVMLEQTEGDSWSEAAEITVDVSLNVAVCPARIEFFARTYPDHVGIFWKIPPSRSIWPMVCHGSFPRFLIRMEVFNRWGADQYGRIR